MLDNIEYSSNLGTYICRPVSGGDTPSVHGNGRAGDTKFPMPNMQAHPNGTLLCDILVRHANPLGIQIIIFNRRIWDVRDLRWDPHTGSSGPHLDHVHWEQNINGARTLTRDLINQILVDEVDDMPWTPQDSTNLQRLADNSAESLALLKAMNFHISGEGRLKALASDMDRLADKMVKPD